jgi:hypothetical protein
MSQGRLAFLATSSESHFSSSNTRPYIHVRQPCPSARIVHTSRTPQTERVEVVSGHLSQAGTSTGSGPGARPGGRGSHPRSTTRISTQTGFGVPKLGCPATHPAQAAHQQPSDKRGHSPSQSDALKTARGRSRCAPAHTLVGPHQQDQAGKCQCATSTTRHDATAYTQIMQSATL